jgi:putative nucleotidyltransferase with HDIG domain
MDQDYRIPIFRVILSLSQALDLVVPKLSNHHLQVSMLAYRMARWLEFGEEEVLDLAVASSLHDIGIVPIKNKHKLLSYRYEAEDNHQLLGSSLLASTPQLARAAELIRYHHTPWQHYKEGISYNIRILSNVIFLADRVSILLETGKPVLSQVDDIVQAISRDEGRRYAPQAVEAFVALSGEEALWLDLISPQLHELLQGLLTQRYLFLDLDGVARLADTFRRIIDYRSRFTASHSTGVAATAEALAQHLGFVRGDVDLMRIAGHLHDLGKLVVPDEILEKPASLSAEEFDVMRTHTYYTYHILDHIPDLDKVKRWAAYHHERLDGSGYPFHLKDEQLCLGARVMAVADVFTALSEDRPYRRGLPPMETLAILRNMAEVRHLDGKVVEVVAANLKEMEEIRMEAQQESLAEFRELQSLG